MTGMAKSHRSWQGEERPDPSGDASRYLTDAVSPIYYIAGSPEMVKGLRTMIHEAGVDDDGIRAEEFGGY